MRTAHIVGFNPLARPDVETDLSVISGVTLEAFSRAWGGEDTTGKPTIERMLGAMPESDRAQVSPEWLSRYAAFAVAHGVEPDKAKIAAATIDEQLPILSPEQDEALMREAGFAGVEVFYVGLAFRGWVAHA